MFECLSGRSKPAAAAWAMPPEGKELPASPAPSSASSEKPHFRPDARRYNEAVDQDDYGALVELMPSATPIEAFDEPLHPWAEDPRTVGCLAAAHLATVARDSDHSVKAALRQVGLIPALVRFLQSSRPDRVECAVVALAHLTAGVRRNASAAYEAGAMPLLLLQQRHPKPGMRASVAITLRHLFVASEEYRSKFAELGGVHFLVGQIAVASREATGHADDQALLCEALDNLQDFAAVRNKAGCHSGLTVETWCAQRAYEAGAIQALARLKKYPDQEVRSSAGQLLLALRAACRSMSA